MDHDIKSLSFQCGFHLPHQWNGYISSIDLTKRHTRITNYMGFAANVKPTNNGKAPNNSPVGNPPNLQDKFKLDHSLIRRILIRQIWWQHKTTKIYKSKFVCISCWKQIEKLKSITKMEDGPCNCLVLQSKIEKCPSPSYRHRSQSACTSAKSNDRSWGSFGNSY